MIRADRYRSVVLCALAIVLASCASTYKPHQGADAVLLRTSQQGALLTIPLLRPLDAAGKCTAVARLPSLSAQPVNPPTTTTIRSTTAPPPPPARTDLRIGMLDSPPPEQVNVAEQRIAPGRYMITMGGTLTGGGLAVLVVSYQCTVSVAFDMQAGEQYWVELRGAERSCAMDIKKVQTVDGIKKWLPLTEPVVRADPSKC
jgi:hypothetical protein